MTVLELKSILRMRVGSFLATGLNHGDSFDGPSLVVTTAKMRNAYKAPGHP